MTRLLLMMLLLAPVALPAATDLLRLEGPVEEGGLLVGHTRPGATVTVDGKPVRVSPEGVFLVGFHRDAPATCRVAVHGPDGKSMVETLKVAHRKYRIQRIDGLPKRKVEPEKRDMKRIYREIAQVKKARNIDSPLTGFLDGFQWPVTGPISGVYGSQRILNGKPRRPHYGVDIARPVGTLVRAPASGVITLAEPDLFFSGGTIMLDHGHGLSSSFLHLSRVLVKVGQSVRQGDPIARIGATGRVTGPHLDWRMNLFEKRIDPQLLAGPMPPG